MEMHKKASSDEPKANNTGEVYTVNNWGVTLSSLTVRHRQSNDSSKQEEATYYNIAEGDTVGPLNIAYETGFLSNLDYWWIKFVTNTASTFDVKNDFYCSISSNDNGNVTLTIDGENSQLQVAFSSSNGCTVAIVEVPGEPE